MSHVMDLVSLFTMAAKKLNHICGPRFPVPWTLSWAVCTNLTPGCSQLPFSHFSSDSISLPSYFFFFCFKPFYSWIVCQFLRDRGRWPFQEHGHESNRLPLRIAGTSQVGLEQKHAKATGGDRTAPGHNTWWCFGFVRSQRSLQSPAWPPVHNPAGGLTDQILILVFDWLPLGTVKVDHFLCVCLPKAKATIKLSLKQEEIYDFQLKESFLQEACLMGPSCGGLRRLGARRPPALRCLLLPAPSLRLGI